MDYADFCLDVKDRMSTILGDDVKVGLRDVTKNNGLILTGLTATGAGSKISPTIYLERFYDMYESGRDMEAITVELAECVNSHIGDRIDAEYYTEYERVRDRIIIKLINRDMNEKLLREVPSRPWNDLAIVYCCLVAQEAEGCATILIRKEHMEGWGVDEAALYEAAMNNMPRLMPDTTDTMENVLYRIMLKKGMDPDLIADMWGGATSDIFILSNMNNLFGASSMIYTQSLKEISERFETGLYIMPSSIHEVIVVPKHDCSDPEYMMTMIREINQTSVDVEDRLSDSLYYYEPATGDIGIVTK